MQNITPRESEIATLIAGGLTSKEIAAKLFISTRTVEAHTSNMLRKTGAKNSSHLVAKCITGNLINLK